MTGAELPGLLPSWVLHLDAAHRSSETIKSYTDTGRRLAAFLGDEPAEPDGIRRFLLAEAARPRGRDGRPMSPATVQRHWRTLNVFFAWAADEDILTPNPMAGVRKPAAAAQAKDIFQPAEIAALLKATAGRDFASRRDHAVISVLTDTGARISGVAGLRFDPADDNRTDLFLTQRQLRIRLNNGETWWVPVGRKTAEVLDRYLRARARHPRRDSPWLWLGTVGHRVDHFGQSGIHAALKRRARQAGLDPATVSAHKFRRTAADGLMAKGATLDDVMAILGWKSVAMPLHYAADRKVARAADTQARLSLRDDF